MSTIEQIGKVIPLQVTYRAHRPGDAARLAELTTVAMPRDAVSEDWFTHTVLLDPNFDPDGLIVAVDEATGQAQGFVYAVRAGRGIGPDPDGGWITIGCVRPDARRQGIGTELVRRAGAFLAGKGAHWVNYAAYPLAYFVPGLDTAAYPDAARLFERAGFRRLYTAAAMSLDLADYATPSDVLDLRAARVADGYAFAAARPDDLPEVISFAAQRLAPDWGEAVRDSVLQHGRIDRVLLARHPEGPVVGFSTYGAYRGLRERFGPYGVDETSRGTGLGKVLLHETLTRMRAEGAQSAWFLWTGEDSPAGHLYLRSGFRITRRFDVLRADLDH
ncbi:GNAT family N-acetyltransferase [Occultella gossypii]|uniref:GNAT family N-acetyltransferase n=1 Tax=Occultella gossypii TaxID=2800820 RepID=A0ABS7SAP6_9MICO|nr:GNAT family N-acetyltransferase [Occultella gossypii]MBZ2197415.1 GNAT family N-acetyltransferase [Occultella gossypii]